MTEQSGHYFPPEVEPNSWIHNYFDIEVRCDLICPANYKSAC
jgi:hypothetical protein